MDASWIFNTAQLASVLDSLRYPQEVIEVLREEAGRIADSSRNEFLSFQRDWIASRRDALEGPTLSIWHALAVTAEIPAALEIHRQRAIPWEVTVATFEDLPRRMANFREINGYWGFDAQRWMRSHVLGRLYQLGRLQYIPGKFYYPATVYRTDEGSVALAAPGLTCKADGWPVSDGQGEECWVTSLERNGDTLAGHRAGPTGAFEREKTTIPADSTLLLDAESTVLHTHIPMGRKLETAECQESLARALPFFKRHFPELGCAAVCCGSWLLDRAFEQFDPRPEKIIAFGRLFTALPFVDSGDTTHYRWAFGAGVDFEKARAITKPTSLQRALLDYVECGGILRNTAGYITPA